MTSDSAPEAGPEPTSRTEEDRVVSRRVPDRSSASADDERAYRAADGDSGPTPDTERASGGTSESARKDLDADDESEPDRSE